MWGPFPSALDQDQQRSNMGSNRRAILPNRLTGLRRGCPIPVCAGSQTPYQDPLTETRASRRWEGQKHQRQDKRRAGSIR